MSVVELIGAKREPQVKWEDRVLEYVTEREERRYGRLKPARRECKDRYKWKLLCCGHPIGGSFQEQASDTQND